MTFKKIMQIEAFFAEIENVCSISEANDAENVSEPIASKPLITKISVMAQFVGSIETNILSYLMTP